MIKVISEHPFIKPGKITKTDVGCYTVKIKKKRLKLFFNGIAIIFKVLFKTDKS